MTDILPGMTDHVIYDYQSDSNNVFEEETANFTSHPASSIPCENPKFEHLIMLEYQIQNACISMAELL